MAASRIYHLPQDGVWEAFRDDGEWQSFKTRTAAAEWAGPGARFPLEDRQRRTRSIPPPPGHKRGNPKAGTGDQSQLAKHLGREFRAALTEHREASKTPRQLAAELAVPNPYQEQRRPFLHDLIVARSGVKSIKPTAAAEAQGRIDLHCRDMNIRGLGYSAPETRDVNAANLDGMVPPMWLLEEVETAVRSRRLMLNAIDIIDPPRGRPLGSQSVLPQASTAAVAETVAELAALTSAATEPEWTDSKKDWATVSSEAVVSLEGIDRGEIVSDALIAELGAAIEEKTEQLIFADGTGNDIDGLGKSGVILAANVTADANATSPTATGMYKHIVDLGTVVSGARKVAPTHVAMHPRRAQRHAEGDHHGHQQRAGVPQRPAARRGHEGAYPSGLCRRTSAPRTTRTSCTPSSARIWRWSARRCTWPSTRSPRWRSGRWSSRRSATSPCTPGTPAQASPR